MINIDFNNINYLVKRETLKVIRETLDSHLNEDNEEKRRQDRLAAVVKKRNLNAQDDAEDVDEAEVEEEETEEETLETGVPVPDEGQREDRTGGKGTADSPKLKTPTAQKLEEPNIKSIVDKINVLRGGASLKDPKIKKSFQQYFNGLTRNEREALLVYMTGISQILAGVSQGEEAIDPQDMGLRVDDKSEKKVQKISKEIKKSKKSEKKDEEIPIVVGESQNKFLVRKAYEAYKLYE